LRAILLLLKFGRVRCTPTGARSTKSTPAEAEAKIVSEKGINDVLNRRDSGKLINNTQRNSRDMSHEMENKSGNIRQFNVNYRSGI